jgi:hypothetical protein
LFDGLNELDYCLHCLAVFGCDDKGQQILGEDWINYDNFVFDRLKARRERDSLDMGVHENFCNLIRLSLVLKWREEPRCSQDVIACFESGGATSIRIGSPTVQTQWQR